MRRTVNNFWKKTAKVSPPSRTKILIIHGNSTFGTTRQARHVLDGKRFQSGSISTVAGYTSLPDTVSEGPEIAFSNEVTVELTSLTRTLLVRQTDWIRILIWVKNVCKCNLADISCLLGVLYV